MRRVARFTASEALELELYMRSINHFAFCVHLASLLLILAACRVDGHYYLPDAEPPADWIARLGGPDGMERAGSAIAAAPDGDLVLLGSFFGTARLGGAPISGSAGDGWIARYRPDGSHLWSVGIVGPLIDTTTAVAVDSSGDVYVAGLSGGDVDFGGGRRTNPGGYIVKLTGASGAYVWDRIFDFAALGLAVIDSGAVVVSGTFGGTIDFGGGTHTATGGRDCILAAYNSSTAAHLWSRPLIDTGVDLNQSCNIVMVGDDVVATGGFSGTAILGGTNLVSAGQGDIFVARFRGTDGAHLWSARHGGMLHDGAHALATDGARIFIGGQFRGTTNLGGPNLTATGGGDAFVAAYSADSGTPAWSQRFGGMGDDEAVAIAASSRQLAVSLNFSDTIIIGTQSFTVSSNANGNDFNSDIAITRLDPARGDPSRAWHFPSTYGPMVVTYADRQLAGSGTFARTTNIFGTALTSLDEGDVAAFRVDLDRAQ